MQALHREPGEANDRVADIHRAITVDVHEGVLVPVGIVADDAEGERRHHAAADRDGALNHDLLLGGHGQGKDDGGEDRDVPLCLHGAPFRVSHSAVSI